MKLLILLISLLCIFSVKTEENYTCAHNPLTKYFHDFLSFTNLDDIKLAIELTKELEAFKKRTPSIQKDLGGKCPQYEGEQTCCTKEMIEAINKLNKGYFTSRIQRGPLKQKEIMKLIEIQLDSCTQSVKKVKEFSSSKRMKELIKRSDDCMHDAVITTVDVIRGSSCALCIDPARLDEYFTNIDKDSDHYNINMIVEKSNWDQYQSEMKANWKCYDDVHADFETYVNEFIAEQGFIAQQACRGVKEQIKLLGMLDCTNLKYFDSMWCHHDQVANVENEIYQRILAQDDIDGYTIRDKGVQVYVPDPDLDNDMNSQILSISAIALTLLVALL